MEPLSVLSSKYLLKLYDWCSVRSLSEGLDDMVKLEDISEATILNNLRRRFLDNNIYTSIGQILISINPFK